MLSTQKLIQTIYGFPSPFFCNLALLTTFGTSWQLLVSLSFLHSITLQILLMLFIWHMQPCEPYTHWYHHVNNNDNISSPYSTISPFGIVGNTYAKTCYSSPPLTTNTKGCRGLPLSPYTQYSGVNQYINKYNYTGVKR